MPIKVENFSIEQIEKLEYLRAYGKKYQKYLKREIRDKELYFFKAQIQGIPSEMIKHVEFFAELDNEFEEITKDDPDVLDYLLKYGKYCNPWGRAKNKNWRGSEFHASGVDLDLFINWLISAIKYPKYRKKGIIVGFQESFPSLQFTPYSIKIAHEIFQKYYNQ